MPRNGDKKYDSSQIYYFLHDIKYYLILINLMKIDEIVVFAGNAGLLPTYL